MKVFIKSYVVCLKLASKLHKPFCSSVEYYPRLTKNIILPFDPIENLLQLMAEKTDLLSLLFTSFTRVKLILLRTWCQIFLLNHYQFVYSNIFLPMNLLFISQLLANFVMYREFNSNFRNCDTPNPLNNYLAFAASANTISLCVVTAFL